MRVLIVDYGRGNLFSLRQALKQLQIEHDVSGDPEMLRRAKRIIFPGVGAFGDAVAGLQDRGLTEALKDAAGRGTPLLGICVGCQLLMTRGEEFGDHDGLDLIPGTVARLPEPVAGASDVNRIPNVGWRRLNVRPHAPVLDVLGDDDLMYFVHSYAPMATHKRNVLATLHINGVDVPVAIWHNNIFGVQFHPEKSGPGGLRLLKKFLETESQI